MPDITDVFQELFYGGGAWLMCIVLVAMILVISVKIRYSIVIFLPISIFLGLNYLAEATATNNLEWIAVIMWLLPVFLIIVELKQRRR